MTYVKELELLPAAQAFYQTQISIIITSKSLNSESKHEALRGKQELKWSYKVRTDNNCSQLDVHKQFLYINHQKVYRKKTRQIMEQCEHEQWRLS